MPATSTSSQNIGKLAKRAGPIDVPAVTLGGVRYEVLHWGMARGLPQNGGYVTASDVASGRELWVLQVYAVVYDARRERDVQDVFIVGLDASDSGQALEVRDEAGRRFRIDPMTQTVRRL